MPTFISYVNWTDQGIRDVKESPHRAEAAKALIRDLGGEVKDLYITSGENDIVLIAEVPDGDVMAKLALAVGAQGNVRTRTVRAWTEEEFQELLSQIP